MSDAKAAADAVVQHARADLTERLRVACPYMSAEVKDKILQDTFANLSLAILEQEQAMVAAHNSIPFFKLPREIRDKIYRLVFEAPKEKSFFRIREDNSQITLAKETTWTVFYLSTSAPTVHLPKATSDSSSYAAKFETKQQHWQKFSETPEIKRLKSFLDHSGKEAASKIKGIVLKLNASSVLEIAVNPFSQGSQMTQFLREDAKPDVSRFAPGFIMNKSKVLAELGLNGYGIAENVFRIEYQTPIGNREVMDNGDYDIEAMEQARIERLERLEEWYEDGSGSECSEF